MGQWVLPPTKLSLFKEIEEKDSAFRPLAYEIQWKGRLFLFIHAMSVTKTGRTLFLFHLRGLKLSCLLIRWPRCESSLPTTATTDQPIQPSSYPHTHIHSPANDPLSALPLSTYQHTKNYPLIQALARDLQIFLAQYPTNPHNVLDYNACAIYMLMYLCSATNVNFSFMCRGHWCIQTDLQGVRRKYCIFLILYKETKLGTAQYLIKLF